MKFLIEKPCELVQYADDTFLFVSSKNLNLGINILENNLKKLNTYVEQHRLNLNDTKTEFIIFCKNQKIR